MVESSVISTMFESTSISKTPSLELTETKILFAFEVNSERDNALVIVTHDQDLASQCDKKIELKLGKIID